jgi:hypothetical protein
MMLFAHIARQLMNHAVLPLRECEISSAFPPPNRICR